MKLACADYTWPSLPHRQALDLIAALGFEGVDIGLFQDRGHVQPSDLRRDGPDRVAGGVLERVGSRGLAVADVFVQLSAGLADRAVSHPDAGVRQAALDEFVDVLPFVRAVGAPGLTVLPGVLHDGDSWDACAERAAAVLAPLVEQASGQGLRVSVEPHVEGLLDTPERTAAFLELCPGLRLTLDYAHFVCSGVEQAAVEPLLPAVAHVQVRGGAPGLLQAGADDDVVDWGRAVATLRDAGYDGWLTTEYVWSPWRGCNRVDNLTETVHLRDTLRADLAADTTPAVPE